MSTKSLILFTSPTAWSKAELDERELDSEQLQPRRPYDEPLTDYPKIDPAAIVVLKRDGTVLKCWRVQAGQKKEFVQSIAFTDLSVVSASLRHTEKSQLAETFSGHIMYFSDSAVPVLSVTAILLNTPDYPWFKEWQYNWDNLFKGSMLVKNDARAHVLLDGVDYEGYFLDYNVTETAQNPNVVTMSFTFIVTKTSNVREAIEDGLDVISVDKLAELTEERKTETTKQMFSGALMNLGRNILTAGLTGLSRTALMSLASVGAYTAAFVTTDAFRRMLNEKSGSELGDIIFNDLVLTDLINGLQIALNSNDRTNVMAWIALAMDVASHISKMFAQAASKGFEAQREQLETGYTIKKFFGSDVEAPDFTPASYDTNDSVNSILDALRRGDTLPLDNNQ